MRNEKAIEALSALAHEHRLAIYRLLVQAGPEGRAAGMIAELLLFPQRNGVCLSMEDAMKQGPGACRRTEAPWSERLTAMGALGAAPTTTDSRVIAWLSVSSISSDLGRSCQDTEYSGAAV